MHPALAGHLRAWRRQTPTRRTPTSCFRHSEAEPCSLSASIFVADHLRPAAKKAGVHIEDGQRFGLHNLRHSLSNWLVNKAKVEPKTLQGILRHANEHKILMSAITHEIRNLSGAVLIVHKNLSRIPSLQNNKDFRALGTLLEGLGKLSEMELRPATDQHTDAIELSTVFD